MVVMDIVGILLTTARVTTDNTIVLAERHRQPLLLTIELSRRAMQGRLQRIALICRVLKRRPATRQLLH